MSNAQNNGAVVEGTAPSYNSPLIPGKKVKIRPIPVPKNSLVTLSSKGDTVRTRSEQIMLTGTSKSILAKINPDTGRWVNIFNNIEEMKYLEHELHATLDPNIIADNYLKTIRIIIAKQNEDIESCYVELDLGNPIDYIKYLICKHSPEVSPIKQDRYMQAHLFYIDDEVIEENLSLEYTSKEDYCIEFLQKIKSDKFKLYNLYKIYAVYHVKQKALNRGATVEVIYNYLRNLCRDKHTLNKLHSIIQKRENNLKWYELTCFALLAMEVGEIKYFTETREYKLASNNILIGKDLESLVEFFGDATNTEIKISIDNKIKQQLF